MTAILKKELKQFMVTMQGYVFIFMMLLAIGAGCFAYNFVAGNSHFENVLSFISMFMIFAVPILTMKAFSEERKQKSDQLMFSLPLTSTQIVLGKYLAHLVILAIPFFVMCLYPLLLTRYGHIDLKTSYSAILAMYFLGAALCAVGMFLSSVTENQLIAAVISFGILFFCYEAGNIGNTFSPGAKDSYIAFIFLSIALALLVLFITKNLMVGAVSLAVFILPLLIIRRFDFMAFAGKFNYVINAFAIFDKMRGFINGIFDITSLLYYISVTFVFLFFTVKVMEMRRCD